MQRTVLVARFLAGAFLCNAVPHLIQGLTGQQFQTPFAGGGLSSPLVNVLWGTANLTAGGFLLSVGGSGSGATGKRSWPGAGSSGPRSAWRWSSGPRRGPWARLVARHPDAAADRQATSRAIPVIALHPRVETRA